MDDFMLEMLACPRCESRPRLFKEGDLLICSECGYGYPITDGIPQLLVEDAIPPEEIGRSNG